MKPWVWVMLGGALGSICTTAAFVVQARLQSGVPLW